MTATVAMLACAVLVSCNDPEIPKPGTEAPPTPPPPLSKKEYVLNNLVVAYLQRDIDNYKRLLDEDYYRFYFSQGDVSNGLPMDGWSRAQDEAATTNLLNRNNPAPNRIVSIDLSVNMSNLDWKEVDADFASPDSTWMSVTTNYSFSMRAANDFTYITTGTPRAQFIVRNIGTDTDPQWRLVRWYDLGDMGYATASAAAVETKTWGGVKALYD